MTEKMETIHNALLRNSAVKEMLARLGGRGVEVKSKAL
jgi:hypothetical protein